VEPTVPHSQELSLPLFQLEIPLRWLLRNPEIDLKLPLTRLAEFVASTFDFIRRHHQGSARSQSTRIGDGE
jgi:hypothetical protein